MSASNEVQVTTTDGAADAKGFSMGTPALVCRWRLADRALPLENRHLRALSRRTVDGRAVSPHLVAWAKQHIEWTLADGAAANPDGVLMLVVDEAGQAAMTVGPYAPLDDAGLPALADRALAAAREVGKTGVAPETLWLVREGGLVCAAAPAAAGSGAGSLVSDLAKTLGISVSYREDALRTLDAAEFDEAFLVSDEHGIVPAEDASGEVSARFADGYARLLEPRR